MKKTARMHRTETLSVVFGFLLASLVLGPAGCSYTAVPRTIPLLADTGSARLSGAVVMVVNGEKDSAVARIPTEDKHASSFKANRQAWTRVLVESLARELARRGASVRSAPGRTFTIRLPEIVFVETRDAYQFKVKAAVVSGRGWSKEYSGSASVNSTSVFSIQKEADRLSAQALSSILQEMLGDDEFIRQVRAK